MNRFLVSAILFLALGVVTISGPWGAASLERRLFEESTAALAGADLDWAKIVVDGQTVQISGVAPSPEAAHEAQRVVLASDGPGGRLRGGVTTVSTQGITVAAPAIASPIAPKPATQKLVTAPAEPAASIGDADPAITEPQETEEQAQPPQTTDIAAQCQRAVDAAVKEETINFRLNSYALSGDDRRLLDRVATQLRDCRGVHLVVEGHTDSRGAQAANLALSRRRAGAVRDYLAQSVRGNVAISVAGFGESQPMAPNTSFAGRMANRRIEFVVKPASVPEESD
ncbi:MAG: OmpA family protein [Parvularculaceae bacterium]|nr:OmpA family protein [Parvularculaceae bacterium]